MTQETQENTPDISQQELQELMLQEQMQLIKNKLLVLSGKGGVGKSTVAANLAISLSRRGFKVGLLDVDVHGPSIPRLLGIENAKIEISENQILPVRIDENLSVISVGLLLPDLTTPVIWRGPKKYGAIKQFLAEVAWGELDYLVVDSPPGTGDEPLSVAQLVGSSSAAVIVTTPQELAIADVRRCVSFCKTLYLPIRGLVENMAGFVCPHCGEEVDIFKSGGGKNLADEIGVELLGQIPIDPEVVRAGDGGKAISDDNTDSITAKAFERIVMKITGEDAPNADASAESQQKERKTMKVAVPTVEGQLCMHFGHCQQFALVEADTESKTVVSTSMLTPPPHAPGVLPVWLHEQGANMVIAGGMGMRAQQLFEQNGISVVVGAPTGTPEDIVKAMMNGTLESGENVCDH